MSRRFLVAVDNSENAEWALNYALSAMDKHLDHLHLITVRDPESAAVYTMHVPYTYDIVGKVNEEEVQRCKKLLRGFARKAHLVGVSFSFFFLQLAHHTHTQRILKSFV